MTPTLVVSHGQPSSPEVPDAAMVEFAARVERDSAGRKVAGATLAMPGALARAADALGADRLLVYPFFMSDGWFVSTNLPRRIATDVSAQATILPPFGLDPALPALAARAAREGAKAAGLDPARTRLILTAHGSPRDPRPAAAARTLAAVAGAGFADWRLGFVDEPPSIEEVARVDGPALCLPLFVAENGHVRIDMAQALAAAHFDGPVLPALGTLPEVPRLVATALARDDPGGC